MSVFKGVFTTIFLTFGVMFLIVFLIRISNGKSPYIGVSDFYYYFQSVDILKPFKQMIYSFNDQIQNFIIVNNSWGAINNIGDFFRTLGEFIPSFMLLFTFPIQMLYYVLLFIGTLLGEIARFFTFVVGNDFIVV